MGLIGLVIHLIGALIGGMVAVIGVPFRVVMSLAGPFAPVLVVLVLVLWLAGGAREVSGYARTGERK